MRSFLPIATLAVLATLIPAAAVQAAAKPAPITATAAWTRPVAPGQMAAGYVTLTNTGKQADRLVAVSSPSATLVTMHQSKMVGTVSTMTPVKTLTLAPGQTVTFAPGGYHLMIQGVTAEQRLGGSLPMVLTFAHAGKVKVGFAVAEAAPK